MKLFARLGAELGVLAFERRLARIGRQEFSSSNLKQDIPGFYALEKQQGFRVGGICKRMPIY